MIRVMKAELFKLFKNKSFRVLCIVSIVLSIMTFITTTSVMDDLLEASTKGMSETQKQQMMNMVSSDSKEKNIVYSGSLGIQLRAKDPLNPTVLEVFHSSFGSGLTELLVGIFIAAFLAKEYSDKTIKNALSYGKKRSSFYLAKFMTILIGIAIILACLVTIPTIGSGILNGWGETFKVSQIGSMITTFIAALIANASMAAIIMIIAIAVKSNGGTIGISAGLFILIPSISSFLYGINKIFDKIYEVTPFYNIQLATSIYASNGDLFKSVIISLITIVLALLAGNEIFKMQDIN